MVGVTGRQIRRLSSRYELSTADMQFAEPFLADLPNVPWDELYHRIISLPGAYQAQAFLILTKLIRGRHLVPSSRSYWLVRLALTSRFAREAARSAEKTALIAGGAS